MYVRWNRQQAGFQDYWIQVFGEGPFKVLARDPVPTSKRILGWPGQREHEDIYFEPGFWLEIELPPGHHFNEYGMQSVTFFHDKWFETVSD